MSIISGARVYVLFVFIIFNFSTSIFGQFSFTVTPTASVCPQNGELAFLSNCTDPSATHTYVVTNTVTNLVFTSMTSPLVGLPAGTYNIVGEKLLGGEIETFTVNGVVIEDEYDPIDFTIETIEEACGTDGKITVIVDGSDLGNVASYEIIGGPMVFPAQASNQFCDLVQGTYRVRVNHTLCPDAMPCLLYTSPSPRDATLSRMPSSA